MCIVDDARGKRFAPFRETVDGSKKWLDGMATAASSLNMSVQYCMAHPAAFMEAIALPAVTNGRASGDYVQPTGNLLGYGRAAPFFSAVGIAPSKDNWWSTSVHFVCFFVFCLVLVIGEVAWIVCIQSLQFQRQHLCSQS